MMEEGKIPGEDEARLQPPAQPLQKDDPIVFQTEDSFWQMLNDGTKTFDMCRWDIADDRIYRLMWFHQKPVWAGIEITHHTFEPKEEEVSFQNKVTGEILTFKYEGMEFADWAAGWCAIILGDRITPKAP